MAGGNGEIKNKLPLWSQKHCSKTRFKIYCSFWLSNNDPNVISPIDFPIFPLIYICVTFLFISYFGGDGRGENREL